ncbi:hypothetical protein QWJ41_12285 [Nocardioides sp. SOB44]|uniref:Cytochrome P450 n=1 Tax=Nocardioides cremeus TaxID=3058044 RepID=A0ABT8TRC1_9ACTN|nr:hypothetical protein [Nocardioides cremeus]MDO3396502.1 hypothetical protein [Nocardioides cremeus]
MNNPLALVRDDLAWSLLRQGYDALPQRWSGDEVATTARLLGRRTVLVRGPEGVRLFYDPDVVRRQGAVPRPLADVLFGRGAVHGLDGAEHRRRKGMFLDLLDRPWVERLAGEVGHELDTVTAGWPGARVRVFEELVGVYGRSVLRVAGVELSRPAADRVARDLAVVVDGFGFAGAAYARAVLQRARLDRWAARLVRDVRHGRVSPPPGTLLHRLAVGEGAALPSRVAGVELLNVLRPTVAVAWLATFAARELVLRPDLAASLGDDRREHVAFGHEVRRLAPFVPALTGLVVRPARLGAVDLRPGDRVLLDVPATDTWPASFPDPDELRPQRFAEEPDAWSYVPQGGGEVDAGHRCPGEPSTVALLAETTRVLCGLDLRAAATTYVDRHRIPTLPEGGLVLQVGPGRSGTNDPAPQRRRAGIVAGEDG